jgi:hypothetical protein
MMVVVFSWVSVHAQETRGRITGAVLDSNGAAVPGATVSIVDASRGTTVTLVTNAEGLFQAPYLLTGTYQVIVEVAGFKKYIQDNVQVRINETRDVSIQLEVGGAAETVQVTAAGSPLTNTDGNLGQIVDAQRIAQLPLVHGDPYTLMGLSPGATYTGSTRLDRPFEPTHIIGFAIDGTRGNRSDVLIDGAPSTATANQNEVIATYVPPSDIVGEFKVQTATFDSQFGNTEGGVTSITIKSGTNDFHGSAYLWKEPGTWAANDFFGNARNQPRPESFSNRFGGYFAGPVRIPKVYDGRNKTFFLFAYEGIRDSRPRFDANSSVFVPTAAMLQGNFSGLGVNIYDPLTAFAGTGPVAMGGNGCNTGTFCRNQFAGNIIPANRLNPVALKIATYFGNPKQPGVLGNIFDSTLTEVTQPYNNFTFRVDQTIGDNDRFFLRGSWYNRFSIYNDYTASAYSGVNFIFAARQAVIDEVHTFDSNTVLNVRYAYNRFIRAQDQEADARGFDLTTLGFPSAFNALTPEDIRRFPRIDFPANTVLGNGMSNENRPVGSHSVAAVLNRVWGRHSFKFGGELRIYREDDNFASNDQTGQFIFDNTYTRVSTATSADTNGLQALASFLLGYPTTASYVRRADYSEFSKTYGFFFQDDWRINSKLTLNLGLRYEVETPLTERQNKSIAGFDATLVHPDNATIQTRYNDLVDPALKALLPTISATGGLLFTGKDRSTYETPKNTFLPRLGFAYQWNNKTVIRGGAGLFAGFLGERRGDVFQPGYTQTTTGVLSSIPVGMSSTPIPFTLSTPFANTPILEPVGNSLGPLTAFGQTINYFNQRPKVSKQLRSEIGVQRQLPGGWVLEAVYVNNYGYDIEVVQNINALPNKYLNTDNSRSAAQISNSNFLTAAVTNPFAGLANYRGTTLFNNTIARSQLLRPFPGFADIITTNNDGKSWYNSAQLRLDRRFAKGFTVGAAYTFSKWLQATEYLNPGDAAPTKMISDQDATHRFSLSTLVSLPFGKGHMFFKDAGPVANAIVGGWQIGGVYQMQSGFPVPFGAFNITTGATSGDLFYRGGSIGLPSDQRNTDHWFNTNAFPSALEFAAFLPVGVTPQNATPAQIATATQAAATAATPANHLRTLPYRFGNVRRDFINNVDLSMVKDILIREGMKVQIRFELINAFNEPYFPQPAVGQTVTSFGQISASNQDNYARRAQIGFKFLF